MRLGGGRSCDPRGWARTYDAAEHQAHGDEGDSTEGGGVHAYARHGAQVGRGIDVRLCVDAHGVRDDVHHPLRRVRNQRHRVAEDAHHQLQKHVPRGDLCAGTACGHHDRSGWANQPAPDCTKLWTHACRAMSSGTTCMRRSISRCNPDPSCWFRRGARFGARCPDVRLQRLRSHKLFRRGRCYVPDTAADLRCRLRVAHEGRLAEM
jgi:hypothetical protein